MQGNRVYSLLHSDHFRTLIKKCDKHNCCELSIERPTRIRAKRETNLNFDETDLPIRKMSMAFPLPPDVFDAQKSHDAQCGVASV